MTRLRTLTVALPAFVLGMAAMYLILEQPRVKAADAAAQQVLVDEKESKFAYANAYRIHTAEQEAIIDFGFTMPDPNTSGNDARVLLKTSNRIALSYVTTKRLSISLNELVKRFEAQFGEIPTAHGPKKP